MSEPNLSKITVKTQGFGMIIATGQAMAAAPTKAAQPTEPTVDFSNDTPEIGEQKKQFANQIAGIDADISLHKSNLDRQNDALQGLQKQSSDMDSQMSDLKDKLDKAPPEKKGEIQQQIHDLENKQAAVAKSIENTQITLNSEQDTIDKSLSKRTETEAQLKKLSGPTLNIPDAPIVGKQLNIEQ